MDEQSITVQINAKSCNAGITLQSNKEVQMPIHCVVARPRAIIDIHTYIHIYNGCQLPAVGQCQRGYKLSI